MWKLTYDAPVGLRTNRGFWGVQVSDVDLWYCYDLDKWVKSFECRGMSMTSCHHKPKTTKAFLRYLKKHPELKGNIVTLAHPTYMKSDSDDGMIEFNIHAEWEEE